ncbi:MAG: hypothetical protein R3C30_15985 [Hyphomonadaceae bacterium]
MQPATYLRRQNAFSRGEREWRVEEDALVTRGGAGRERRYPWKDIVSVRLCYEPTRLKPWRYVFEVQPRHQRKFEIDNGHYVGPGQFEERSDSYAAFVRAATGRLAEANPKARALIGETPKRYFFLLLVALLGLGALAYVLVAIPTPLDAMPYSSLIKLGILLLMLPIFWRWVIGAVPRGVPLDAIPERALPPSTGS